MRFRDSMLANIDFHELQNRVGDLETPEFRAAILHLTSRLLPELKDNERTFSLLISVLSPVGRAQFLDELFSVAVLSDSLKQTLVSQITKENVLAKTVSNKVITAAEDEASIDIAIEGTVESLVKHLARRLHLLVQMEAAERGGFHVLRDRLADIAALYDLSPTAVDVLIVLYLYQRHGPLSRACEQDRPTLFALELAEVLDASRREIAELLLKSGTLVRHFLVTEEGWEEPPFRPAGIVVSALDGVSAGPGEEAARNGIRTDCDPVYPLDTFPADPSVTSVLVRLASSPRATHVLLYGVAGAGKTELARSVARATGKITSLVQFPSGEKADLTSVVDRVGIIRQAAARLQAERSVLIIDEADEILNTETPFGEMSKEPLVHLLESIGVCTIWVANRRGGIHPAIVRRFSYSLAFNRADERIALQRLQSELVASNRNLPAKLRARIVREYPVSLGSISKAVQLASSICSDESQEDFAGVLQHLVESESALLTGSVPRRPVTTLTGARYLDDVIHCTPAPDFVIPSVQRFVSTDALSRSGPLNLLLFGGPGTGKSAFAHRLSEQVGVPLHEYSGADLLSSGVGETEQAIRDMFNRASEANAIVLLDEAENLLQERSTARSGWERQHVNEFLNRMERHNTVFLCSTNQLSLLDHAVLRRFAFKVEFFPLKPEDRVRSYRAYFSHSSRRLTGALQREVASLQGLTLGTIRTVYNQVQLQDQSAVSHAQIIDLLRSELRLCRPNDARPVGFCA